MIFLAPRRMRRGAFSSFDTPGPSVYGKGMSNGRIFTTQLFSFVFFFFSVPRRVPVTLQK